MRIGPYETDFRRLRNAREYQDGKNVVRICDRAYCPFCGNVILIALTNGEKISYRSLHNKCAGR